MYKKTVLNNGTRLIFVPSHDTKAMTLLVLFELGSRYESKKLSGAAHYIEHMMFKGTKKRPSTRKISRDLDSVGADYNAFTGKEYTGYYIKLNAERSELAVDMLHDMLFNSTYKKVECDRERGVILEEINMYEDNPIMHAEEMLEELLYDGCPLGRNIAGTHKTMKGIDRDMLVNFRDEYYIPSRMVVSVAGKINDDVMSLIKNTFGKVRSVKKVAKKYTCAKLITGKPKLSIKFKETEQVQFTLGFPAYKYGHKNMPALSLLTTILGGGMSSRLFSEVREKRGLAYSVRAGISPYLDIGNFAIQAGLTKSKLDEGISTIMNELRKMVKKGVTSEELKRGKEYIKGKMILNLEDSSVLAEFFAKQELLSGKIESPEDKLKKIEAVTKEDIQRVAKQVLQTNKLSSAIIGPFTDKKRFMKLLKV